MVLRNYQIYKEIVRPITNKNLVANDFIIQIKFEPRKFCFAQCRREILLCLLFPSL